mgnify:CR=1 FL=1
MCTIKFLEIFFRKFEYLLGNNITMLRKAKETKLRLIQESNMRLLKEGPVDENGSIEKLVNLGNRGWDIKKVYWEQDTDESEYILGIRIQFEDGSEMIIKK